MYELICGQDLHTELRSETTATLRTASMD